MQQHKADRECKKQAVACVTYKATNQLRMASRRALEWIGMFKVQMVFRYEISDLFMYGQPGCNWNCTKLDS